MALTETQKTKIIVLLGYPGTTIVENSINYSNTINSRLTANLTAEIEALVTEYLNQIADVDTKLLPKAIKRAGVEQVDNIKFNGEELREIRKERMRLIKELSRMLDIPTTNLAGMMVNVCA